MRILVVPLLLLALPAAALAADPPKPVSEKPLWFRVFFGTKPPKLVIGFLDESKGTGGGDDVAVVDLDGDGVPETRQTSDLRTVFFEDGREIEQSNTVPDLEVRVGEHVFHVEFESLGWTDLSALSWLSVDWSVHSGKAILQFRDGHLGLSPTREAAKRSPPLRIGPPFHLRASADTLGPDATVQMMVEDAGGFELSGFFADGVERGPRVVLTRDGEEGGRAVAEYG